MNCPLCKKPLMITTSLCGRIWHFTCQTGEDGCNFIDIKLIADDKPKAIALFEQITKGGQK